MESVKRTVRLVCRLLLGGIFAFSGMAKAIDPMGFTYKLQDYFAAFGLEWMGGVSIILAILLSSLELFVGLLLLLDELRPFAVWGAAGFMLFFTPLTLYLAIANPVSDCGCFGDAFILSNWETFGKNIVLLAASLALLKGRWHRQLWRFSSKRWRQAAVWGGLGLFALSPNLYALRHLPLVDFRAYHVGADLIGGMRIPENAERPVYATTFVYEKDGAEKTFTEEDYPWDDTAWHFVSSDTRLVSEGYVPPIKDFHLYDGSGTDKAEEFLNTPGFSILVVAPFLERVTDEEAARLQELYEAAQNEGMQMALVTSSPSETQGEYRAQGLHVPIYTGDERVLKTVIRASPGVLALLRGVVIGKWAMRDLPDAHFFSGNLLSNTLTAAKSQSHYGWMVGLLIGLLVVKVYLANVRKGDNSRVVGEG